MSGRSLVVDNKGAVVQGHGRPSAVLDSVVLPCKVCYGLLLYSSDQAADGSEPWCLGLACAPCVLPLRVADAGSFHRLRRAQSPSELKMARLVPQDARFRFSCTGKAIHLLQGPSRSGAARKVVLPVCSGLEVVSSNEGAEALGAAPHERG